MPASSPPSISQRLSTQTCPEGQSLVNSQSRPGGGVDPQSQATKRQRREKRRVGVTLESYRETRASTSPAFDS